MPASAREVVLEAWHALNEASVHADAAALERLYADDYVFVTYRGTIENKSHQIELFKSGVMKFTGGGWQLVSGQVTPILK